MTRVPGRSYVVGGAVRDRLLGLPVSDRDHVVVGTTAEAMTAAGFRPVGRDFPVFLHPETHEEYALARTERKVAPGYAGFVFHADPSVTLEADLERRDLTINAMAEDDADGRVIDPFGGREDLERKVFRHVGPAFAEDPVRILRVARFAARFADFVPAPETVALMRAMADSGEVDALVPERVWQELARGLMEDRPDRLFAVLEEAGALSRLLPELTALGAARWNETMHALRRAAQSGLTLEERFALLFARIAEVDDPVASVARLSARLAVPRAARELAMLVARERDVLISIPTWSDAIDRRTATIAVFERCDAFRRSARFRQLLAAVGRDDRRPGPACRVRRVFRRIVVRGARSRRRDRGPRCWRRRRLDHCGVARGAPRRARAPCLSEEGATVVRTRHCCVMVMR